MGSFLRNIVVFFAVVFATVCVGVAQPSYPVYVSVQVVPPAGIYLTDYYSGTRDRLVVTLINRDNQQPVANVKLRVVIRNSSVFELRSREELYYPMLTLESGVPLRLTSMDLQPYLAPDRVAMNGYLENGRLPNGMTEFRVQALDYTTGRVLSEVAVGRVWLESKQPPLLSQPSKNDLVALRNPQHLRFQWTPRHQGLAQTEYEFVLKELPDNGVPPQTAFLYGPEIYRTDTRRTTLDYGTMEPPLEPGKKYGWQVRAKALDGVDEIGVFDNRGYSEISWFEVSDNCPEVTQLKATAGFRRIDLSWHHHPDQNAFVVQWRPKTQSAMYEWQSATVFEASHTITQLQEGWTYEYRVGALCIRDTPVFGLSGEVTLPEKNEERLKNCGKVPTIDLTNDKPNENLKVGDIVTIGGDFPMRVDEVTAQGNGWYSGKGGLVLPWVFEIGVNVEFARLRVNTDNVQIDGEVETVYDQEESLIGNTNELDYGGNTLEPGGIGFPPVPVDFTVPPLAQASYDESTGELTIADEDGGNPQTVTIPKNGAKSSFPIEIVDAEGNRYQIDVLDDVANVYSGKKESPRLKRLRVKQEEYANIVSIIDQLNQIKIDFDTTQHAHISTANIIGKYLLEYSTRFGDQTIPIKIRVENQLGISNIVAYGLFNSIDTVVSFSCEILSLSENQQRHTVYHELAHYNQWKIKPRAFKSPPTILLTEFRDLIRIISLYPMEARSNYSNINYAETVYNLEAYAEIDAKLRQEIDLNPNLTQKINNLEIKKLNNKISNGEIEKLNQLKQEKNEFYQKARLVLEMLTK